MPNVTISFNTTRPNGLTANHAVGTEAGRWLINALTAAVSGRNQSNGIVWSANDSSGLGNTANLGAAMAALNLSTASGAVGGTIGGTLVTVTASGGDTATATALAAAIRANATVNRKVTATNLAMSLTLAAVTAGQYVDIGNIRFTAISGTPTENGQFDISGGNTAGAASLALAINRHPATAMHYAAVGNAAACVVFLSTDRQSTKWDNITNPGGFSTFTLGARIPTAATLVAVIASVPGDIGNEVRLTASGTGVTAVTPGTAGFLGGGVGGGTLPFYFKP